MAEIDRSAPAAIIAEKFGGLAEFARSFDPPKAPSTVHRWLESGLIPAKHQADVLDAARRKKIKLRPQDFIPQRAAAE